MNGIGSAFNHRRSFMNSELQQIETAVNRFVGKPLAWFFYGLLILAKCGVRGGSWLRHRWTAYRSAA
jgi:hypothetical protein